MSSKYSNRDEVANQSVNQTKVIYYGLPFITMEDSDLDKTVYGIEVTEDGIGNA